LTLSQANRTLAENLYWVGTSAYARPNAVLNLNGAWNHKLGGDNKGGGWREIILPSYWKKPPEPLPEGVSAFYRRTVVIPKQMAKTPIEFYCAGLEGNDEVFWNGKRIGGTEKFMYIKPGNDERVFAERLAERKALELGKPYESPFPKPPKENIRCWSDPYTVPNLIKRFYPNPTDAIKRGKNLLEIRLYGKQALGISEPVYIRTASTSDQQAEIVRYENARAYLSDLRALPQAEIEGDVLHRSLILKPGQKTVFKLRLKNPTPHMAFFTGLKLDGLDDEAALFYSDNYFSMLPGTKKVVTVRLVNNRGFSGRLKVRFALRGWNIGKKKIGKVLLLRLR
jgi:hypothetical protein